jgi:hypothetical protein
MGLTDEQLFEIAAKLHNLSMGDLRLKKRYLDAVVIEELDGTKHTHAVAELEALWRPPFLGEAVHGEAVHSDSDVDEPEPAPSKKPQHTRKR